MNNIMEIFNEFNKHLLEDDKPSIFFNKLIESNKIPLTTYPFNLLSDLKQVPQSTVHHPEGNVWNHTMLVIDEAAKRKEQSKNPRVFMWAALLHDLGKKDTTKERKGKITAYDHDKVGEVLARKFLMEMTNDTELIKEVSALVRWHMQILFVVKNMPFADIKSMNEQTSINEVALLSECDRLGRGEMTEEKIKNEKEHVRDFLVKCKEHLDKLTIDN